MNRIERDLKCDKAKSLIGLCYNMYKNTYYDKIELVYYQSIRF